MPARLPRAARRAQVIEAAAAAFVARGFDGTSMDDVAQAAGVTRLIVYRIFETKHQLYRAVLGTVLVELGRVFDGADIDELRRRGVTRVMLPVARAHPDAFRLLWHHAWHEPDFGDIAVEFRHSVTVYARALLGPYIIDDEVRLDWAARTAGAHLMDGLCNWLDVGDPARDDELGDVMVAGIRALAATWSNGS